MDDISSHAAKLCMLEKYACSSTDLRVALEVDGTTGTHCCVEYTLVSSLICTMDVLLVCCEWYLPGWGDGWGMTNTALDHDAGSIASSSNGPYTAVLEQTGTSIVIFKDEQWSTATALVTLPQFAAGTFSDKFLPTLSWSPKGTFLVLCTTQGHLIVVTGAPIVSPVSTRAQPHLRLVEAKALGHIQGLCYAAPRTRSYHPQNGAVAYLDLVAGLHA